MKLTQGAKIATGRSSKKKHGDGGTCFAPTIFLLNNNHAVQQALLDILAATGWRVERHSSCGSFLQKYDRRMPGCVVLDVNLPDMSGLELQERLSAKKIDIPLIFLTADADIPTAVRAVKKGAFDFLEKPCDERILLERIRSAVDQHVRCRDRQKRHAVQNSRVNSLTVREREVLDLVVEGMSSKQIGEVLGISPKTVEAHRAKIMRKLEVRSIAHLIRIWLTRDGNDPPAAGDAGPEKTSSRQTA